MSETMSAPAEVAPQAAPIAPPADDVAPPAPIKTEPQQKEPEKPSLRETLSKAKEKVEAKDAAETKALKADPKTKAEPVKVEVKAKSDEGKELAEGENAASDQAKKAGAAADKTNDQARVPDTARDSGQNDDRAAPKRFTQEARTTWDALGPEHDNLKAETHRAFREMEAGIQKYREPAARYEAFKEFDELARTSNVDAKATLTGYVRIDQALHSQDAGSKLAGIAEVLKVAGVTPEQYARHILRQAPAAGEQPRQQQQDVSKIVQQQIQQALAPVVQHLSQQQQERHEAVLEDWAKDKPHFEELADRIRELVVDDKLLPDDAYVKALTEARDKARAFLGDSALKTPSSKPGGIDAGELEAQTLKGSKSITGAPGSGSTPAAKGPVPSIREALKRRLASRA